MFEGNFFSRYDNKLEGSLTYSIAEMMIQMCVLCGVLFATGIHNGVSMVQNLRKVQYNSTLAVIKQEGGGNHRWSRFHQTNLDNVCGQNWAYTFEAWWCRSLS